MIDVEIVDLPLENVDVEAESGLQLRHEAVGTVDLDTVEVLTIVIAADSANQVAGAVVGPQFFQSKLEDVVV